MIKPKNGVPPKYASAGVAAQAKRGLPPQSAALLRTLPVIPPVPAAGLLAARPGVAAVAPRANVVRVPSVVRWPRPASQLQAKLTVPAVPPAFAPAQRRFSVTPPMPGVWPPGPATAWRTRTSVAQLHKVPTTSRSSALIQRSFIAGGMTFSKPVDHEFTSASALTATQPIPRGEAKSETGRGAGSGVAIADVGSYGYVQYLEKKGDGLTGDHQPSGAAVKEAVRELLHSALLQPLTRSMARNAYQKAITIVMSDVWHKKFSRTYGGRNTKAQILQDASDLSEAAMKDWQTTVTGLKKEGLSATEITGVWDALNEAREAFFASGEAQAGTL